MKTSELQGAALDWAVAKCEGLRTYIEVVEGFKPSTDWAQGGPIIEREGIAVRRVHNSLWDSFVWPIEHVEEGQTPLIAAMRWYVASKLGDEIEVPEELK